MFINCMWFSCPLLFIRLCPSPMLLLIYTAFWVGNYPWTLTVFCWRWCISFDSCLFVLLSGLAITHERLQYFIEYAMYKFVSSVALPSISMMSLNQWIVLACIRGFMYKYLVCFGWGQRLKFLNYFCRACLTTNNC